MSASLFPPSLPELTGSIFEQVDPLVSLMKVEKVPDSTYDMIGGLDQQIKDTLNAIPDHQIFAGETFKPAFTFLTLNSGQTASPKLMAAVERAGFKLIFTGSPRGSKQSWFLLDTSGTFKAA